MRILIVKLSSLGDLLHALPAVAQLQAAWGAEIDWVVNTAYVNLVRRFTPVSRVIGFPRRHFSRHARGFARELRAQPYDLILDMQGLLKSALVGLAAMSAAITSESIASSETLDSKADSSVRQISSQKSTGAEATSAKEETGTYYPLCFSNNTYLAAMAYDPPSASWRNVLPATMSPAGIFLSPLPQDQRSWLAVLSHNEKADTWALEHGSWFGRLSTEPEGETISTMESEITTRVGLPIETFVLPNTAKTVTVQVYCTDLKKVVEVIPGLPGGTTFEFSIPDWNRWYRIDFIDESDGSVIESQWIGHERTH